MLTRQHPGMLNQMAESKWLSEPEQRMWRAFADMQRQLNEVLDRDLTHKSGLSVADYTLLMPLSEAPGHRLRARDLRMLVLWDRSRLAHQVRRMEQRGLISRCECDTDARGIMIQLTADGLRAIQSAAPGHFEAVRRYFVDLVRPEEMDTLRAVAERVLDRIAADNCGKNGEQPAADG
jgi:DNA-binding MarR family transcriptional regulator